MFFRRQNINLNIAFCLGDGCGLGNLLQALPAIQALSAAGHRIDIFVSSCTYPDMTEIVAGQPYVRTVYTDTYRSREATYDICIVSFLSGHRVENAGKYIQLKADWHKRSEYEEYCRVAEKFGAAQFNPPALTIAGRGFNLQPRSILFHAGCSPKKQWERKRWPHYAELAERLLQDGFSMYCCGAEDEVISHPRVTTYNSLPIQQTAALIQQCDLFVSNDSGLMHLAAALRKKQIAVFTATSPKKSAPHYNPNCSVLTPAVPCFPCQGSTAAWENCHDWRCHEALSVDAVYQAIRNTAVA
jgi:ADP-heptose:LPS heptosyltransferase